MIKDIKKHWAEYAIGIIWGSMFCLMIWEGLGL